MIVDGRAIAEDVYKELAARRARFARAPRLGILVGQSSPVIESFVRIKMRAAARLDVAVVGMDMSDGATTDDTVRAVGTLARKTDGIIVQLPLPSQFGVDTVLGAIPKENDIDAINPNIPFGEKMVNAPVALAVVEILRASQIEPNGTRVAIVGAGRLVGAPSAALLAALGARVSMITLAAGSLHDLKDADIIVSGAGQPGLIQPEHIRDGAVLIDAGTSESDGKVVGDADPACAEKCALFTPVPGGVGPIAIAMIFKNLFDLVERGS